MQFITSLFGGSGNTLLTAGFALGIVLVLIVLGVWLLKVIFNASANVGRGRNRRLSVVDSLPLDPKRQLLIIRRDNVEHLILTGGAQDIVVETGIPVPEAVPAQTGRRVAPAPGLRKAARPASVVAPSVKPEPARVLAEPAVSAKSLRHTGLMRATEPTLPDNQDQQRPDSAKENLGQTQVESAEFDDDSFDPKRDGQTVGRG